jgi:SAM-dependent methyltransferase
MSVYAQLKLTFRTVVPTPVRDAVWSKRNPLRGALLSIKGALERSAAHDEIYDHAYYERSADAKRVTMQHIADSIVRDTSPRTLVDVGCGGGFLLTALAQRGITCFGLEYSQAGIDLCRSVGLDVRRFDLEHDTFDDRSFDVAVSMEVAEHLPATVADRFVDLLARVAPVVVFTAARPGQVGTDHVNEQPPEYWIERFAARGFALNGTLADAWKREWETLGVIECYRDNLMVFSRSADS